MRPAFVYAGAAALLVPLFVLGTVLALGVNLPFWDEWEYAHFVYLDQLGKLSLADVWQAHNDHRIFFTTVLALGLAKLGGWDVVREQCVSVAALVVTQAILWSLLRRTAGLLYAPLALLPLTVALYNLAQVETLSWGAQMGWFVSNLCVVATVWLLTAERVSALRYAAAIAVATIGSLTMSQGMIAWPIGLACVVARRERLPRAIAWALAGALVVALVQIGTHPDPKLPQAAVVTHLPAFVLFVLAYLGAPLAASFGVGAAALLGAFTLAVLAVMLAADLRSADRSRAFALRLPWYAIASYVLIAALLTPQTRLGFGVAYALQSRYTTIASLLEVAIVGLLATHAASGGLRFRQLAMSVVAVLMIGVATQSAYGFGRWQAIAAQRHADVGALARGELIGSDLYWNPPRLPELFGELRDTRSGIFAP